MRAAVLVYPGSNCDRDMAVALRAAGADVTMVWHKEDALPAGTDLVAVPGGFSFGDYLRCGAIAARAPITSALIDHARRGGFVLGVCNGFQILCEAGLLPGALMRNSGLKFMCRPADLSVQTADSPFTQNYQRGATITLPVAHHDGNYRIDAQGRQQLDAEDRVAFRYSSSLNGSQDGIAGVLSANRRVLGLMPHPERAIDAQLGNTDGLALFSGLLSSFQHA